MVLDTPSDARDPALRRQERAENFPVALRVLPATVRRQLRAVYDVARVIDDLGDEAPGDRTKQLVDFRTDLLRAWGRSEPESPAVRRLVPTVREVGLRPEPFERLIEANLQDQIVSAYRTFEDLLEYCRLSAEPVGRIVLAVFGVTDPRATAYSDRICTALQLMEHWQDVGEDRRAGRIYLPGEEMEAFGVEESDLDDGACSPALRRLLGMQTHRAVAMLDSGAPLVGRLHGWARVAVAGFVAGGRAAGSALARARFDVLPDGPRARRVEVVGALTRLLVVPPR